MVLRLHRGVHGDARGAHVRPEQLASHVKNRVMLRASPRRFAPITSCGANALARWRLRLAAANLCLSPPVATTRAYLAQAALRSMYTKYIFEVSCCPAARRGVMYGVFTLLRSALQTQGLARKLATLTLWPPYGGAGLRRAK